MAKARAGSKKKRSSKKDIEVNNTTTVNGAEKESKTNGVEMPIQKKPRSKHFGYIEDKKSRNSCFSKRKRGLLKKASEIAAMTGCEVHLIIVPANGKKATISSTENLQQLTSFTSVKSYIEETEKRKAGGGAALKV